MKKKTAIILASATAAGVYSAVTGKGIFNKIRFKEQHDAAARYVDSHYPGSAYAPITAAGSGWATVISRPRSPKIFLYFTRSENGVYVFHETDVRE